MIIQQTVFDTLYELSSDTAANTEIYYHETVKLIESNNWVAIYVPIFIAVLALGFSLWQFYLQRKEKKVQNTPYLDFRLEETVSNLSLNSFIKAYTGILSNTGLGPAKISSIRYRYDVMTTKTYDDLIELIVNILDDKDIGNYIDIHNSFISELPSYLNSESEIVLFKFIIKDNGEDRAKIISKKINSILIYIEYENMYGIKYPMKNRTLSNKTMNQMKFISSLVTKDNY